jgi:hypothetical protein
MKPTSLAAVLVFLVSYYTGSVRAQTHDTHDTKDEIPIERCDRLPIVTMKVAGESRRFLLDTAATTIFNLKIQTSHMPVSREFAAPLVRDADNTSKWFS